MEFPQNKAFWAGVLRRIRQRIGKEENAEDLLHSAFIRVDRYKNHHEVRNLAALLVQAAVNINLDERRREAALPRDPVESGLGVSDSRPLLDEEIEARFRLDRIRDGLARLSPRTRTVFLMHRIEGAKYREIAQRLGISESSVEKHIAKAMLFLTEYTRGW